jgi:hypothetical protein
MKGGRDRDALWPQNRLHRETFVSVQIATQSHHGPERCAPDALASAALAAQTEIVVLRNIRKLPIVAPPGFARGGRATRVSFRRPLVEARQPIVLRVDPSTSTR